MDLITVSLAILLTFALSVAVWRSDYLSRHVTLRRSPFRQGMRSHPTRTLIFIVTLVAVSFALGGAVVGAGCGATLAILRGYQLGAASVVGATAGFLAVFCAVELRGLLAFRCMHGSSVK